MPNIQFKATILEHTARTNSVNELVLAATPQMSTARPGQFVEIAVSDTWDPLLRRPLSICRVMRDGTWSVVYRVQGRGTECLARATAGGALDVIGPLGQGFRLPGDSVAGTVALVGGGVGVPPLVFLAQALREAAITPVVMCGFATAADAICLEHFASLDVPVQVATEDGTMGRRGLVTQILAEAPAVSQVYACGPIGMLRAVVSYCNDRSIACQVSLEEKMACGVGACLSCVCPGRKAGEVGWQWRRVCKEGPVFDATEVAFDVM